MVDLNGAGGAVLGGLTGSGSGEVHNWLVTLVAPGEADSVPTTTPGLVVKQESWDGGPAQVQMQVSTDPAFGSTVHDSTVSQASGTEVVRLVTGLNDNTHYHWRARAGDGTYWGLWTTVQRFTVDVDTGRGFAQMYLNVGVNLVADKHAFTEMYLNVGFERILVDNLPQYVYENVGIELSRVDNWPVYVYEGDVNSATPNPHLWFLIPGSGRAGDGVQIVGWGFGDLQSTYSGVVEVQYPDPIGWTAIPVVSWQTFPADPPAYTEDRVLDEVENIIDMQHTVIQITVPADAVPPGYPIRVRTDGP